MNTKTINGVSRELLSNLLKIASRKCNSAWAAIICEELRVLLDSPSDGVNWGIVANEQKGIIEQQQNLIASLRAELSESYRIDSKPHGEPMAWIKPDVAKTLTKDECCYAFGSQNPRGTLIPLYTRPAEQPAPVAVVMPERKPQRITDSYAEGWNAYDDEWKRLNPGVKP